VVESRANRGLACIIAVAFDTGLSPIDARSLTLAQMHDTGDTAYFQIDPAKTGMAPDRAGVDAVDRVPDYSET